MSARVTCAPLVNVYTACFTRKKALNSVRQGRRRSLDPSLPTEQTTLAPRPLGGHPRSDGRSARPGWGIPLTTVPYPAASTLWLIERIQGPSLFSEVQAITWHGQCSDREGLIVRNLSLSRLLLLALAAAAARVFFTWLASDPSEARGSVDDTLDASFPASDPPAWTSATAGAAITRR